MKVYIVGMIVGGFLLAVVMPMAFGDDMSIEDLHKEIDSLKRIVAAQDQRILCLEREVASLKENRASGEVRLKQDITLPRTSESGWRTYSNRDVIDKTAYQLKDPQGRILWFRDRKYDVESIYHQGFFGYSEAAHIAKELNIASEEIKDDVPLSLEFLRDFDAVMFLNIESNEPLSEEEQEVFRQYVSEGGAALVIGQQDMGQPLSREANFANSVTLPYGIRFTEDVAESTRKIAKHKITKGITEVQGGGSTLVIEKPAYSLAPDSTRESVLSISTYGKGRIVAVSDDGTFADIALQRKGISSKNSKALFENILRWMIGF